MSWKGIMRRVLPPIGGVSPEITSPYGAVKGRTPPSSIPHGGVDFNYSVGPTGINLTHPALRSPVSGIVTTKPGEGTFGRIAIRDKNGFSHEILHTHTQFLTAGDPVAAGQLIGTMGNTGTEQQHVHYQLKDPAGNIVNPTAFWDRQGPVDPNPSPPAYLQEYQQYLQGLGVNAGNGFGNAPDVARAPAVPFVPHNDVLSPDRQNSFGDRFEKWGSAPVGISAPAPSDRPESFDNRFGNWGSAPASGASDANSPLLRALEKYRRSAVPDPASVAAEPTLAPSSPDNSPALVFDPTKPPPAFTPSNYASALSNIDKWIASLTGIDPDDPTEFSPPPIFSPFYRR